MSGDMGEGGARAGYVRVRTREVPLVLWLHSTQHNYCTTATAVLETHYGLFYLEIESDIRQVLHVAEYTYS